MVYPSLAWEWPIKTGDLFLFNETGYLQDRSRIFIYVNEAFYQNLQAPSMHISVDVLKFQTLVAYKRAKSNSADPDQTASEEAVWSEASLFAILDKLWGPHGFWGSGENGYLSSGSWGALVIIFRDFWELGI